MGADLTAENIENIKLNYKKTNQESISGIKTNPQDIYNLNLTFKKLYKSKKCKKFKEENKINNIDKIDSIHFSISTFKSEEEPKVKNNLKSLDDTKEINNIIFRNHKSFEPTTSYSIVNQKKCDEPHNNKKLDNDIISTITTTVNTNKIGSYNSVQESESDDSDYIDISQSIFFNKINKKFCYAKEFYSNSKNIRDAYYNKLIIKNIWQPYRENKKSNTLFFFDWDDTLMCTSAILPFLNSNQLSKNTNKIREKLKTLDEIIFNLLKIALERGIVFLITNASPGWVEYSSANFLPLTSVILNKIKIYSAKALFSKNYPGDPIQWKMRAYKYVIEKNNINTRIVSNIICFGDSIIDLEAMESLRYIFNSCYIKVIKFKENPNLVQLEKQIWIVISQLDFIITKARNLTLKISKKKIN